LIAFCTSFHGNGIQAKNYHRLCWPQGAKDENGMVFDKTSQHTASIFTLDVHVVLRPQGVDSYTFGLATAIKIIAQINKVPKTRHRNPVKNSYK
jgi:hypothetical protein